MKRATPLHKIFEKKKCFSFKYLKENSHSIVAFTNAY